MRPNLPARTRPVRSDSGTLREMRIVPWIEPLFRDREAAGRVLAAAVASVPEPPESPVVVGVARGGVAVALEVARALAAPLTAVDVERVNAHGRRLGAVTADGSAYLREGHGVPEPAVASALDRARRFAEALDARLDLRDLPIVGRTALVVDDGVVTGLTLAAACRWARNRGAGRVVAATPVGRVDGLALLAGRRTASCPAPAGRAGRRRPGLRHLRAAGRVVRRRSPGGGPLDRWRSAR